MSVKTLYTITDAQIEGIFKQYGTDKQRVAEDVKILEEWVRNQPHFPTGYQYGNLLERALSVSKFDMERAKKRIETFLISKLKNKDFYEVFESARYIPAHENRILILPLPKLGPLNERIVIFRGDFSGWSSSEYDFQYFLQVTIASLELAMKFDKTNSFRIVADGAGYTFGYVKKIQWGKAYRCLDLLINGYGARLAACDIINALPTARILFNFAKTVIKAKLVQRVKFHSDMESLYESIPREYLPEEYGGSSGKLPEIREILSAAIEENRHAIANSAKYMMGKKTAKGDGTSSNQTSGNFGGSLEVD